MRAGLNGGQLTILSNQELHDIYLAILDVLENHGVKFQHEGALKLMDEIGATVDYKTQTVRFPEFIVEESLRKAPKVVRLCGRNREQDFVIEGKKVYFGSVGGATVLTDRRTGQRRDSTTEDMAETAKVCDALENIDYAMGLFTPLDAPPEIEGLYEQDAVMSNTVKHSIIFAYHGREMTRKQIEIARLFAGGEDELRERPIVSMYDEPSSPMIVGKEYAEALLEWAKEGLPIIYAPCPMGGATAPITLAGEVVSGMAESIAGNVLAQFTRPGTPFIFGFVPLTMDMRTTLCSYGAPEDNLLGIAEAQLAHYMGIPLWGTGGCTDAKTLDAQAFVEATTTLTTAALSGQNLIHDIGLIEAAKGGSQELIVICDEIIGMLKRMMGGVRVGGDTLAVEQINGVPHGGSFLGLKHSLENFNKEFRLSQVMDRSFSYETWKKTDGKTLLEKAQDRVQKILRDHRVEPIPREARTQIEQIKKEAVKSKA